MGRVVVEVGAGVLGGLGMVAGGWLSGVEVGGWLPGLAGLGLVVGGVVGGWVAACLGWLRGLLFVFSSSLLFLLVAWLVVFWFLLFFDFWLLLLLSFVLLAFSCLNDLLHVCDCCSEVRALRSSWARIT